MHSTHYTAIAQAADRSGAVVFAAGYLDCYGSTQAIAVVKHDLADRNVFQVVYYTLSTPRRLGSEIYAEERGGNAVTSDLGAALAEYGREVSPA